MTESPEATVIAPGVGTITDAKGNIYALGAAGAALENGKPIPDGGGTSLLAYHDHVVYGQDAKTGYWYAWEAPYWVSVPPPLAQVTKLAISVIGPQKVKTPFQVTGTFALTSLLVTADNGAAVPVNPESTTFSFSHPGFSAAGTETVSVAVFGVTAKSNSFQVS